MANVSLTENTEFYRIDAQRKLDPKDRSALGQFMTPAPIARFMASLFSDHSSDPIQLLDPGSGIGSLTAAFIEEFATRSTKPSHIDATAYEIEHVLLDYLDTTIQACKALCAEHGIELHNYINTIDFILDGVRLLSFDLFNNPNPEAAFTHVIMNPPYRKITSMSDHRKWLRSIDIETTNLYTGFLAIAIKLLKHQGELVAIVPRSFCNGPYYKPFRDFLLSQMVIRHIHVFESRSMAFKDDEVLQENIIFHAVKSSSIGKVTITSSPGASFQIEDQSDELVTEDMTHRIVPYTSIVNPNDPENFIHIASTELEQHIVDRLSVFNHTLSDLGIEVSTGPVVDFRLRSDLLQDHEDGSAALLYPTHFQGGRLTWPKNTKKPNAIRISRKSERWLYPNHGNYVVTKRFSSKEEKRRIVAAVYDASLPGDLIGFENHLNVFHAKQRGLTKEIAGALALYLNSTLLDKYFRQFSGHTQVNATDLRSMHYPSRETLERLGSNIPENPTQQEIDEILNEEINTMAETSNIDPLKAQQKIDDALAIIKSLGLPRGQHNERSALTLLAILNLKSKGNWQELERPLIGITPIMEFCRDHYGKEYAPNTRETFRRQTMHQFVDAGIAVYNPDRPDRPVNSPKTCYQISAEAFDVAFAFNTNKWNDTLAHFLKNRSSLAQRYAKVRNMQMIPVKIADDEEINLTPGKHSQLIRDIIGKFAPRYAPGSEVIYVGDTGDKIGYFQKDRLSKFDVHVDKHGKMPDVVLYFPEKDWLLLVESVTSHGPVDAKRHGELAKLFKNASPGLLYVTAFPNRGTMARYLTEISWETEVWCADAPTHLIHFNGERFLGPYQQ